MAKRSLPKTEEARNAALTAAKTKYNSMPVGEKILNENTGTQLVATQPQFSTLMAACAVALFNQGDATKALNVLRNRLRMFISHFFQNIFMGIARGIFPNAAKAFYMLDMSTNAVPKLDSEEQILTWGDRIKTGDAARTTAGGVAMAMPTITEFTTVYDDFVTANTSHSTLKDAYDNAQKAVADLRPDVDALILRIWNEVETWYSNEDIASRRRYAREWGVVYENLPDEYSMEGKITDMDNNPVEGALISVSGTGISAVSNDAGNYYMPVVAAGTYTIEVSKTGYNTQSIPNVQINEGVITILNVQLMAISGTLSVNVYSEGLPLEGATVRILQTGAEQITGAEGQVVFTPLEAGNYDVQVSAPGKQPQTKPVTITSGHTTSLVFDLLPE